jgi:hypothetical protein
MGRRDLEYVYIARLHECWQTRFKAAIQTLTLMKEMLKSLC